MSDEASIQERVAGETGSFPEAVGDATQAMDGGADQVNQSLSDDPMVGQVFDGKYVVEKLIGVGGMGRVYKGRNTRTDGPVAIKTLLPDLVSDESLVERFKIEAQSASKLAHPNTIRIFDFGREEHLLFMVMELLDGEPMEKLLEREVRLEPARLLHIMGQVCRSLAEAHAAGLVHRDMKPDNIFLNRVGNDTRDHVKVLDFGVAKLKQKAPGQATLTQAGMIFGTPRYMSPEQARALDIDGRSDIYSLGVIMFEALTGTPPFEAPDPISILVKHVNEPIPTFESVAADMSPLPDLEEIVRRCMAKEPDERFDDVENLLNALEAASARFSRYGTDPAIMSPSATVSMNTSRRSTPMPNRPSTGALDALGVSGDAGATRFTMGSEVAVPPSGPHSVPGGNRSFVGVVIGVVVLLAALGGGLLAVVGGGGEDPVEADAGEEELVEPVPEPPPADPGEAVIAAVGSAERAFDSASSAAASATVVVPLVVSPSSATVSVDGGEPQPVEQPLVFVHADGAAERTVVLELQARGHRTLRHELELPRAADAPLELALQRVPREVAPPDPARQDRPREDASNVAPPDGLPDPFQK